MTSKDFFLTDIKKVSQSYFYWNSIVGKHVAFNYAIPVIGEITKMWFATSIILIMETYFESKLNKNRSGEFTMVYTL